ncbi:hypothetical protein STEG23_019481, partial [Scotinomys teguina]
FTSNKSLTFHVVLPFGLKATQIFWQFLYFLPRLLSVHQMCALPPPVLAFTSPDWEIGLASLFPSAPAAGSRKSKYQARFIPLGYFTNNLFLIRASPPQLVIKDPINGMEQDEGTEGFKGNARVILPGMTTCVECSLELYSTQVNSSMCTIASMPKLPEHCIEYIRMLQWPKEQPFGDEVPLDGNDPEHIQWNFQKLSKCKALGPIPELLSRHYKRNVEIPKVELR